MIASRATELRLDSNTAFFVALLLVFGGWFALRMSGQLVGMQLAPGAVDNALKNGWAGGGQAWTSWLSVAFFVFGAATFTLAARRWYAGQKARAERGTADINLQERPR